MAAVIVDRQPDPENNRELLIYDNGMIKDSVTGYIVKPPPDAMITEENSSAFHRRREELRKSAALDAANAFVDTLKDDKIPLKYGDMRYMYALTTAAMRKATTKSDPKAIEAARFVGQMTGDLDDSKKDETSGASDSLRDFFKDLASRLKVEVHLHEAKSSIDK